MKNDWGPTAWRRILVIALGLAVAGLWSGTGHAAWQPTKPVEFNVAAGTGGGADLMARFISPLFQKNNITKSPWIVTNRPGGAGAEGVDRGDVRTAGPRLDQRVDAALGVLGKRTLGEHGVIVRRRGEEEQQDREGRGPVPGAGPVDRRAGRA